MILPSVVLLLAFCSVKSEDQLSPYGEEEALDDLTGLSDVIQRFNAVRRLMRRDYQVHEPPEGWTGRWFPEKPTPAPSRHPEFTIVDPKTPGQEDAGYHHQSMMDVDPACDDGQTNLSIDWDENPVNYTCFDPLNRLEPDSTIPNLLIEDLIPKAYTAPHRCMNEAIHYKNSLPTYGPHRPVWARWGEYKFLPRQRWLHNLEHGGVVMLYDPCASPTLRNKLKKLVTSCLYRHVITPYTLLSPERPFALVTWGWSLSMSTIDEDLVKKFIREHALRGPEQMNKDGLYDLLLQTPSAKVTDFDDSTLCP